jgi:hypothetical protein
LIDIAPVATCSFDIAENLLDLDAPTASKSSTLAWGEPLH